jgi:DNA-binding response OmpR family regulator
LAEIIVVDDDVGVRAMLEEYVGAVGHRVRLAADGAALDRLLTERPADLAILDVGLPGESGLRIARRLREHAGIGIIMLTGAATPVDRVVGLEVGADDYVAKPVDLAELAARIEAVLRRRRPADLLPFGPYTFDVKGFRLLDAEQKPVPLGEMELDLVAAFATRPGKVLGRAELMKLAPPRGDDPFSRSIDKRVTRLRAKLERVPDKPELIKTVRGGGYVYPGQGY